jgi:hypothetical protein
MLVATTPSVPSPPTIAVSGPPANADVPVSMTVSTCAA